MEDRGLRVAPIPRQEPDHDAGNRREIGRCAHGNEKRLPDAFVMYLGEQSPVLVVDLLDVNARSLSEWHAAPFMSGSLPRTS